MLRKNLISFVEESIPEEIKQSKIYQEKHKNVRKSYSPLKVNGYNSTKFCSSESSSPIKLCKVNMKPIMSAKGIFDESSDELSIISSVSSSSCSSQRKNNLQSNKIIIDKCNRFSPINLQNLNSKKNLLSSKQGKDTLRMWDDRIFSNYSKNKSQERKEKAESYLKDLGCYFLPLKINPSDQIKPFSFSESPEVRKKFRGDNCRKKRRNTVRTDLRLINWKQLSSNLIELEKELDSKYPQPDYSQTLVCKNKDESKDNIVEKSNSINSDENKDELSNQIQLIKIASDACSSNSIDDSCDKKSDKDICEPYEPSDQYFVSNDRFQKEYIKAHANCMFTSMKNINNCDKFKDDEFNNESGGKIINLQYINCNEADSVNLNMSHLEFKKRKRIMSNIDNNVGAKKKKVSPKKKRKNMRKCSITNSEFKSICSTYEQQCNSTNIESNNSKSLVSSECCSNNFIESLSPDTKNQRDNESRINQYYESNSLVEKRLSQFSHQRSVKISNENNQESSIKKLNLTKIRSMRKKTIDFESYDTANLLSIMGKLSQIEDKI